MSGKVALITGGASGIGASFAEHLLQNGAKVAICDVNRPLLDKCVKFLSGEYGNENILDLACDVTNNEELEDSFKKTIENFGKLDIVINNAGKVNEVAKYLENVIDKAVVKGTFLANKYMGKQYGGKGGAVINISSKSSLQAFPTLPIYSSTKAAINQFSRSQGDKFLYDLTGIKVISINPGLTAATPLTLNITRAVIFPDEFSRVCKYLKIQRVENMGRGLIEILNTAESGDIWTIENDEPPHKTIIS